MGLYRSTVRLRSASASLWQADTLFGHLCWSLVRREGEEFLTALFLAEYRAGRPPVLISDGFPEGYLPRPRVGAPAPAAQPQAKAARIAGYRQIKDRLKARWLTVDEFNRSCRGELVAPGRQPEPPTRTVSKNQIDRLTNTAGGEAGMLYDFTEFCLAAVDVYWSVADGYVSVVQAFLEDLKRTGYGKRRSVGYGQIDAVEFAPFNGFAAVPDANGFMTLSNFIPAAADPTDGFWTTQVKYGKLGEDGAVGGQPFKRPLIQLAAGSCFYDRTARHWYGRLVPAVAADPTVVQYGYAFPVRVRLPE
jgi:CRISPR-associated protein Csm4